MEENPNIDNYQDEGIDILALVKQIITETGQLGQSAPVQDIQYFFPKQAVSIRQNPDRMHLRIPFLPLIVIPVIVLAVDFKQADKPRCHQNLLHRPVHIHQYERSFRQSFFNHH